MTPKPGTQLGPYEILAAIGAGGMGEVYRAKDTRLGRSVAIKVLNKEHMERLEREARAIAALNHPHICTLYDLGPDYLVMEFIEGEPVKGPLQVEEAVRLSIQIAGALEDAHRIGILHRDLKPGNIMVTASGSAKLLDFGLAKLVAETGADTASTMEGTVMGTPAYMSPEQAQGKPVDARSDIFSFGAPLYEMLSGRRAFDAASTAQVISAVLRDEPKPMQTLPQLERIVMRCLAKQPSQRYQTISEVKTALEQILMKPAESRPSIAVLPFANMSGDKEQEYFSDGLAEEIINVLAQIPGLKVTARTSSFAFRGKEQDIRRIAETLGVHTILEGSVRRAGNRIRVTAQLINAEDGYHLWSQRYDREMTDIFAIQDEIASAIAGALQVELSAGPEGPQPYTPNLLAYDACLRARHHFAAATPESLERSRQCAEQAIALDPGFAAAHIQLGDYFLRLASLGLLPANEAMPAVREQARTALEIDPALPEGHAMLGIVAGMYEYDWKEAGRRFHLAMMCSPVPPRVHGWHGHFYLNHVGRVQEAIEECERALKFDPLNVLNLVQLSICFLTAGRHEAAEAELRKALDLNESHLDALYLLALNYAVQGMLPEALAFAEKAYSLAPWNHFEIGLMAALLSRTGDAKRAEEVLEMLGDGHEYGGSLGFAWFHLICGEMEKAAGWIEKAVGQRNLSVFSCFTLGLIFCSSPRWTALKKQINLPETSAL